MRRQHFFKWGSVRLCSSSRKPSSKQHRGQTIRPFGPSFSRHLPPHNRFKPGVCVAAGRWEEVCSRVYSAGVLSLPATSPNREETREKRGRLWPPQGTPCLELAYPPPNEAVLKNSNTCKKIKNKKSTAHHAAAYLNQIQTRPVAVQFP